MTNNSSLGKTQSDIELWRGGAPDSLRNYISLDRNKDVTINDYCFRFTFLVLGSTFSQYTRFGRLLCNISTTLKTVKRV